MIQIISPVRCMTMAIVAKNVNISICILSFTLFRIVYPNRTANGGYVNVELTSTCINGLKYSDTEHRCV